MRQKWFEFRAQADDPTVAEIQIVDFIGDWVDDYWGFGVTAKGFIDQISKLPAAVKTIRVHVNSPGGDVFSALNIANALRDQRATKGRAVETIVDGIAASAASVVIMAGDPVRIADNGLVMIHNPWSVAIGDRFEMEKVTEVLDKLREAIVATYQWHSELKPEEIVALMDAETWMDADEAIANGFASEKVEGLRAAASIDPRRAAGLKVPERFAAQVKALMAMDPNAPKVGDRVKVIVTPHEEGHDEGVVRQALDGALGIEFDSMPDTVHHWYVPSEVMVTVPADMQPAADPAAEPTKKKKEPMMRASAPEGTAKAEDVIRMCASAGLDLTFADGLLHAGLDATEAQRRVSAEKDRRAAENTRQEGIRALCDKFKCADLAPELIGGGVPLRDAQTIVAKVTAMVDRVEIDGGLPPDPGNRPKSVINVTQVYRQRNGLPH